MSSATDGSGATLTYGSLAADITGISWSGMERDMIEATHLGTADAKEFIAARLYDAGSVTIEMNVDDVQHVTEMKTYQNAAQAIGISFKDLSGATVSVSLNGFMQSLDPLSANSGEQVTASATFKLTGAVA